MPPPPFAHDLPLGAAHVHGLASAQALDDRFDVCIIGSGASGAVAADAFVRAGWRTLLVEEGARLHPGADNASVDAAAPTALAGSDLRGWSERGWPWSTRNLGGGTVFYGGASFRYTDFDFDPSERIRVEDLEVRWPIGPSDLEPFYRRMEARLAINRAGFEACAQAPSKLSMPGERLWEGALSLGNAPRQTPLAIDRGRCDACSLCISAQCASGAKRDVVSTFLVPVAGAFNLVLLTGVRAMSLNQATRRHVDAVRVIDIDSGAVRFVRARLFVLACNAIQTAALLLRSVSQHAPHGLGNQYDLVGRGLCMKLSEYTEGRVDCDAAQIDAHPIGYRGPFSTVSVLDHYLDPRCPTGVGGLIYEAKHDDWRALQGPGLVLRVETILADHPSSRNRVRLAAATDAWGMPRIAIDYTPDERDLKRLGYMLARSADWLRACGAEGIRSEASNFTLGSTHLHGTCRAGKDPARSVVDREGRVHSVDNVHVVDGSYMPYPGGLNPTLTIQANALRIACHLAGPPALTIRTVDGLQAEPI